MIVSHYSDLGGGQMVCRLCGGNFDPPPRAQLPELLDAIDAWGRLHQVCVVDYAPRKQRVTVDRGQLEVA